MTDTPKAQPPESRVFCRRTQRELPVHDHQDCPYCHGKEQVHTGVHTKFCGYDPEKDPVSFGFPEDSERLQRG
ncbi:MAG: hypothetical protein IPM29_28820 [Planctomycetes bacterium]|nr:hypothetical protein [Planctomycetota bacterium]